MVQVNGRNYEHYRRPQNERLTGSRIAPLSRSAVSSFITVTATLEVQLPVKCSRAADQPVEGAVQCNIIVGQTALCL